MVSIAKKECIICLKEFSVEVGYKKGRPRNTCSEICNSEKIRQSALRGYYKMKEDPNRWKRKQEIDKKSKHKRAGKVDDGFCDGCGVFGSLQRDHDHSCCDTVNINSCGVCIRGYLCANCNKTLAFAKDDPIRLIKLVEYIEKYNGGRR